MAIARAIATRPDVLLCDEPTGALDSQTGVQVLQALKRVNGDLGTATDVITHNVAIRTTAQRVIRFASAAFGALRAALSAARLPPAVAMQPPAPPRFRHGLADRLMARLNLSQPATMILRSITRWPARAAMSALGLSMAIGVLAAASFFDDAMDKMLDTTFGQANRQDATLNFVENRLEAVPGRCAAFPARFRSKGN